MDLSRDAGDRIERAGLTLQHLADALLLLKIVIGERPLSVRAAADTFNTTPHLIQGVVREFSSGCLYLVGPHETPGTQFIEFTDAEVKRFVDHLASAPPVEGDTTDPYQDV